MFYIDTYEYCKKKKRDKEENITPENSLQRYLEPRPSVGSALDMIHVCSINAFLYNNRHLIYKISTLFHAFQNIGSMCCFRMISRNHEWIKGKPLYTLRSLKPDRNSAVIECQEGSNIWGVIIHNNGKIDVYAQETDTWHLDDIELFLTSSYYRLNTHNYVHSTRTIITEPLQNTTEIDIERFYTDVVLENYNSASEGLLNVQIPRKNGSKHYRGTLTKTNTIKPKTNKTARSNIANQVSSEVRIDGTIVNVKLFKNGLMQMTGLKTHEDSNQGDSAYKIIEMYMQKLLDLNFIQNKPQKYPDIRPIMIKGSFDIGFKINRNKLFQVMTNGYNIWCNYDRNISRYQLVKIYYFDNSYNDGLCHCDVSNNSFSSKQKYTSSKKKQTYDNTNSYTWCRGDKFCWQNGGCKIVTLMVASTGKVNIAGGIYHSQQIRAYETINKILQYEKDNIELFDPSHLMD